MARSSGSPSTDDLTYRSAVDTADLVRTGELTAVEVVEAHMNRIDQVNGHVNAVTRVNEKALAEAEAVDRSIAAGASLSLAGVPVTIKDNVDVAGEATPNGLPALSANIAAEDAPLVENLRAAGAVILGRTNTPEFSWRWHTDNPLFGATLNPWDSKLTPGGSSGGASAALAAGIGCLAQGNDAGGSVRWPANCTGVSALKPTTGRIPSHNVTAAGERPLGVDFVAVQGPMARSAADVRVMLDVMSMTTWRDPGYVPARMQAGHRMRAGRCLGAGPAPHPEVVEAVELACTALTESGWAVERVDVPDLAASARGWATLINTDFHQTNRATMQEIGSPAIEMTLEVFDLAGPAVNLAGMYELLAERAAQIRQWQQLLTTEVDVVVLPVTMEPAWPAGVDTSSRERLEGVFAANTPLFAFNFLGLPVAAQPTSIVGNRPNGVQIVARPFAEYVALDAAAAIEKVLGQFTPPSDWHPLIEASVGSAE